MTKYFFLVIFIFSCFVANSQNRYTVSGSITDENGETLIGVNVYDSEKNTGSVSNEYGFFSIKLPEGEHTLIFSFIGYRIQTEKINLNKHLRINIKLLPETTEIEEVTISTTRPDRNVTDMRMSTIQLQPQTIKKIPVLLGETDIIKSIQLLPGVQSSVEGSSGFYVRGGNADQNLVLLDEATVYNPSHLFGFFSVFNSDAVKGVQLYKGGIPAEFGGRLSSVLDVRMKEGSTHKIQGEGGIGFISSRLTVEGPVVKNKLSFIVSGRRTYSDLFLPFATDSVARESKIYFYDLNAKLNWAIGENDRIFLSGYFGRDVNKFGNLFQVDYGNATGTLRWNHVYNGRLFSNVTFIYSDFNYELGVPQGTLGFKWISNIVDYSFKNDYTWYLNPNNTIVFGFQTTHHTIKPGVSESLGESIFTEVNYPYAYGIESGLFIGNDQLISDKLGLSYGIRYSLFQNIGKATLYQYDSDHEVIDTLHKSRGDIFNWYDGFEPRLSIRYKINEKNSVKASYNRTFQYMHLASNSTATFPLDMWFMSSSNVLPQYADQGAIGYFRNFKNNSIETSVEVYYKKMYNTIDFKDHAQLVPNEFLEGELRIGESYAYGLEVYAKKNTGKLTGWVSYTYSRAIRHVPEINYGKEYPAPYDKPHNVSVVLSYDVNKRFTVSGNWVYSSALPVTVPKGGFYYGKVWIPYYTERGGMRIPGTSYHRLDLSLTYYMKMFGLKSNLNFSVYNAYNRHNAFAIYFRDRKLRPDFDSSGNGDLADGVDVIKLYLFPIIPAVTLNVKF